MAQDAGKVIHLAWQFLENIFKSRGKPTPDEALSLASNTRLLKAAESSNELKAILGRFGDQLKYFVDEAGKSKLEGLAKALASPKPEVRLKALERFYGELEKTFNVTGSAALKDLVSRAVREIGTDALRAIPHFEFGYRRYLSRMRKKDPNFTSTFADYLEKSDSKKLRLILKSMLASDQLKSILRSRRTYSPANGNIQIAQHAADAIKSNLSDAFSQMPQTVVLDLIFKKLGPIKDFELTNASIYALLKQAMLVRIIDVDALKQFPRGYLQNLQGNLGEMIAMAFKARRLEDLRKVRGDAVYLFQDVRVNGKRIVPDKKDPRFKLDEDTPDVVPGDISEKELRDLEMPGMSREQQKTELAGIPATEADRSGVEFSDDFIVDLADPKRPEFVEQFESKVTRQSLEDGREQIARNIEVMSQTSELTVGRVLKLKDGKWVDVPLSKVAGTQITTGKDGVQRLLFKENEEWLEKVDDIMEELSNKIADTRRKLPEGPERDKEIAKLIKEYDNKLPERSLQGLVSSDKYLTVPKDHVKDGFLPSNVKLVPFELGGLELSYKEIVDFCNLLLLRSGWHKLFD